MCNRWLLSVALRLNQILLCITHTLHFQFLITYTRSVCEWRNSIELVCHTSSALSCHFPGSQCTIVKIVPEAQKALPLHRVLRLWWHQVLAIPLWARPCALRSSLCAAIKNFVHVSRVNIRTGLALVELVTGVKPWCGFRSMKDLSAAFAKKVRVPKSVDSREGQ